MSENTTIPIEGKTISAFDAAVDDETARMTFSDGTTLALWHEQDCCERVRIAQIDGDPQSLVGSVVRAAYIATEHNGDTKWGTETWTFIHIRCDAGDLCLRWHGESNGYYSEDVDVALIDGDVATFIGNPYRSTVNRGEYGFPSLD